MDRHILDQLYDILLARRGADPHSSHTAKMYKKGPAKIAQKLGEEAVETLIEGVKGDKEKLKSESADLLYFLLLLWAVNGLKPEEVWAELAARGGDRK
jgi:phosphoribosyl-ATP pyrophosphohydrolase